MEHLASERLGRHGAVASPDQLATQAGMAALAAGGSAVDAAIAGNAVLAVTFQHQCGLGGDLMAIVRTGNGEVVGLESAGPAGSMVHPRPVSAGRYRRLAPNDPSAVTLPGCLDGWLLLHERFGRLPWSALFDEAIRLATEGFALTTQLASDLTTLDDWHLVDAWLARSDPSTSSPGTPIPGTGLRAPRLAETLAQVAEAPDRSALFAGNPADALLSMEGSPFAGPDLERPVARSVAPISLRALGAELFTLPPVSQGYLTLAQSALLDRLELGASTPDDPRALALAVESWILLGQDRARRLGDGVEASTLLEPSHLDRVADEVRRARSLKDLLATAERRTPSEPPPLPSTGEDTIAIVAADADGGAAVLVQSLGSRFGARRAWPGTGILLHSRGMGFSVDPGHPAHLAPGRRPPHTLSPTFAALDGAREPGELTWVALGTMGADSQPQILTQLLWRLLGGDKDAAVRPGAALAAPRATVAPSMDPPHPARNGFWTWEADALAVDVEVEDASSPRADHLVERGHQVRRYRIGADRFGHAQVVARLHTGSLDAASDPRSPAGAALTR